MNHLVQILTDEDGEFQGEKDANDKVVEWPAWCCITDEAGSPAALCTGQVFGDGEGAATFKTKETRKGGITCRRCLSRVREIKSIRL